LEKGSFIKKKNKFKLKYEIPIEPIPKSKNKKEKFILTNRVII